MFTSTMTTQARNKIIYIPRQRMLPKIENCRKKAAQRAKAFCFKDTQLHNQHSLDTALYNVTTIPSKLTALINVAAHQYLEALRKFLLREPQMRELAPCL